MNQLGNPNIKRSLEIHPNKPNQPPQAKIVLAQLKFREARTRGDVLVPTVIDLICLEIFNPAEKIIANHDSLIGLKRGDVVLLKDFRWLLITNNESIESYDYGNYTLYTSNLKCYDVDQVCDRLRLLNFRLEEVYNIWKNV